MLCMMDRVDAGERYIEAKVHKALSFVVLQCLIYSLICVWGRGGGRSERGISDIN